MICWVHCIGDGGTVLRKMKRTVRLIVHVLLSTMSGSLSLVS